MIQQREKSTTVPTAAAEHARLERARATLAHTHQATACDWLWKLAARNIRRIDARRVLAAEIEEREQHRAYHPRMLDRARGIW